MRSSLLRVVKLSGPNFVHMIELQFQWKKPTVIVEETCTAWSCLLGLGSMPWCSMAICQPCPLGGMSIFFNDYSQGQVPWLALGTSLNNGYDNGNCSNCHCLPIPRETGGGEWEGGGPGYHENKGSQLSWALLWKSNALSHRSGS